jgi:hypothetical protein
MRTKLKFKLILSFAFAVGSLTACSEKQSSAAVSSSSIVLGEEANKIAMPPPIPNTVDLITGLEGGRSATITLDKCPTTAEFKQRDPLGTLICGEKYNVFWNAEKSSWSVIGPNEGLPKPNGFEPTAATYRGTSPKSRLIIAWGLGLKIEDNKELSMDTVGTVGTLVHSQTGL